MSTLEQVEQGKCGGKAQSGKAEKRGSRANTALTRTCTHTHGHMGTYVVRIRVSRLRVLCAVLNSRLNCFLLEIYLTQQTTTMSLLAMRESGVEERERERDCVRMRRRVGKGVGENDTHNCSIISHKVKNCCSILGVIQSRLSSSSGRAGQTWLLYENVLWYFPESTHHAGTYVDIPSPHRHAATFWADNCIYGCSFNVITGLVKMGIKRLPYCTCLPWLLLFFFYRALFWSPAKSNFKVEEYHTNERDHYGR